MQLIAKAGTDDLATVYIGKFPDGRLIECVESCQPPLTRAEKWVLIVSSLWGCPVRCKFCDAGSDYQGRLSAAEILAQIDAMVERHYPDRVVPVKKLKIQFARMGEPALNPAVLDVLEMLPGRYPGAGLLPSLSSIAPQGSEAFFERLLSIKNSFYPANFQLQFSLHTTDLARRDWLIPVKKWSFPTIAAYGERFYSGRGRKITLNFALAEDSPLDPAQLREYFSPDYYLIKITPLNPTAQAARHNLSSYNQSNEYQRLEEQIRQAGYDVIISIGELEENRIGSNCGQCISHYRQAAQGVPDGYCYDLQALEER
jgi:23S rRNA (adenine2503-C2)-methyltransferase